MDEQLREQIISYEKHTRTSLSGNALAGGILLFFLWPVIDKQLAFIWYALLTIFNLLRHSALSHLNKKSSILKISASATASIYQQSLFLPVSGHLAFIGFSQPMNLSFSCYTSQF